MTADNEKLAKDFVEGGQDDQGRQIKEIFCQTDEFVFYSIAEGDSEKFGQNISFDTGDENKDRSRGRELSINLNKVKPLFNKYKVMWCDDLYRKREYFKKSATALSTALNGQVEEAVEMFNAFILEAQVERDSELKKRLAFTLVGMVWVILCTVIALIVYFNRFDIVGAGHKSLLEALFCILFSSYGAYISISIKVGLKKIDALVDHKQFFLYAAERMMVANIGGLFVYTALKSEFVFGFAAGESYFIYVALLLSILAGFSERFAPDMLSKLNEKVKNDIP